MHKIRMEGMATTLAKIVAMAQVAPSLFVGKLHGKINYNWKVPW